MSAAELKTFKAEVAAAKKSKVRYRMDERQYDTLIEENAEVFTAGADQYLEFAEFVR